MRCHTSLNCCRLEGQIAQRDVLYSSSEGAITQGNVADIAVVFTLPVSELDEAMFSVSGPTTYNLTDFSVLSPDFTSFSFSVEVPMDFFGKATVFFNEVSLDLGSPSNRLSLHREGCATAEVYQGQK